MKQLLLALFGAALIFFRPVISDPCEVRVLMDAHTRYDIDGTEISRLLEENGFSCPYILDLMVWDQVELDRILQSDGRASVAKYTIYPNGHHLISSYLVDLYLEDAPGHNFSVVNSLSGADWGTWIILHELGHMIWNGRGWLYSDGTEFWCDHFADENYGQYSIIVER